MRKRQNNKINKIKWKCFRCVLVGSNAPVRACVRVCMYVNLCIWTGAQCEINLNCNHNCHSIHCILLLLLLYSYVMCCVWMNCHDSLLDFADAAQWSSLKRTIKTTVLSFTCSILRVFFLSFPYLFPLTSSLSLFPPFVSRIFFCLFLS